MEILLALFGAFIAILCVGFVAFVAYDSGRHRYSLMLADAQGKQAIAAQQVKQLEIILRASDDKLHGQDLLIVHLREANRKLLLRSVLLNQGVTAVAEKVAS